MQIIIIITCCIFEFLLHRMIVDVLLTLFSLSIDAHYGPGPGCQSNAAITRGYPEGDQVSELVARFARDNDEELLGMAVVSSAGEEGVWQYLRGNWSMTRQTLINTESG